MSIKQDVQSFIKTSFGRHTKANIYATAAKHFNIPPKTVSAYYLELVKKGEINDELSIPEVNFPPSEVKKVFKDGFSQHGDAAEITKTVYKRIKTLADLIEICEIDLTTWEIVSWECNKWEVGRKDKKVDLSWNKGVVDGSVDDSGVVFVEPLFQVKAKLRLRKVETDLQLQKQTILDELRTYAPKKGKLAVRSDNSSDLLLEIAIPDLHLGSLVWHEETGDNYDLKIAEERFKDAIYTLLGRTDLTRIGKILLPIGNDFLNIDNKNNSTTNGTVVDTDCRFMKMIKCAKRLLVETIDDLAKIAPVDVVIVPGNHDYTMSLVLGDILEAFYHNDANVSIDNSLKSRKYYQFGDVGIQLTHGDEEKHADLGLIFATEEPLLWAATKYRFVQLGHLHRNKKTNYISVNEHTGFQVQILPSLSSTTAWAYKKGYNSLKQAKAFLYHPTQGELAEYTHTV